MTSRTGSLCLAVSLLMAFVFAIGLSSGLAGAQEVVWQPGKFVPCTKCHPTEPEPTPVVAAETIDYTACFDCHSSRYPPEPPSAEKAHVAHAGVLPGKHGNWTKHMLAEEMVTAGKAECSDCHFQIANQDCMLACHGKQMPHVGTRTDCSSCHGTTPEIARHLMSLTVHDRLFGEPPVACFSCHNPRNLDTLLSPTSEEIPYEAPPALCYFCHSPEYKLWKAGKHHLPAEGMADCTDSECHDPHNPTLPGPLVGPQEEAVTLDVMMLPIFEELLKPLVGPHRATLSALPEIPIPYVAAEGLFALILLIGAVIYIVKRRREG